jgi:outer membrane protein assembly factor BamE (lipoprotein component of BamABCDE complex)
MTIRIRIRRRKTAGRRIAPGAHAKRRGAAPLMPALPARRRLLLAGCGFLFAACTPNVLHHGYLPRKGDFEKIREGMSKAEVEAILGTPSTTATIDVDGDSYYYISTVTEQKAFMKPKVIDRKVFAIRFDRNGLVKSFALYGLEDGEIVNISDRKTPTRGRELTILQQIFSNIGSVGPAIGE